LFAGKSSSIFIPVKPNVNTTAEMELTDMTSACVEQTRKQITMEIGASFQYLALGVHFSQDHINLPGFAKFFFDAASEEREHAYKLIEYLSMRGSYMKAIKAYENNNRNHNDAIYVEDIFKTISENPVPETTDGAEALKLALKKEKEVTNSIRTLIQVCEKEEEGPMNHYHVSFSINC
jgi:ferritin heavy chain